MPTCCRPGRPCFPPSASRRSGGVESTAAEDAAAPGSGLRQHRGGAHRAAARRRRLCRASSISQRGHDLEDLQDYRKAIVQSLVDVENALIAVQQNTEHEKRLAAVVEVLAAGLRHHRGAPEGGDDRHRHRAATTEQTLFRRPGRPGRGAPGAVSRRCRAWPRRSAAAGRGPRSWSCRSRSTLRPVPAERLAPRAAERQAIAVSERRS